MDCSTRFLVGCFRCVVDCFTKAFGLKILPEKNARGTCGGAFSSNAANQQEAHGSQGGGRLPGVCRSAGRARLSPRRSGRAMGRANGISVLSLILLYKTIDCGARSADGGTQTKGTKVRSPPGQMREKPQHLRVRVRTTARARAILLGGVLRGLRALRVVRVVRARQVSIASIQGKLPSRQFPLPRIAFPATPRTRN